MGISIGSGSELSPFGAWLMDILSSRQLTATEFAQSMGITPGMVSRYMRSGMPVERRWRQMIEVLGLTEEEIQSAQTTFQPEEKHRSLTDFNQHQFRLQSMPIAQLCRQSIERHIRLMGWEWEANSKNEIVPFWLKVFSEERSEGKASSVLINLGDLWLDFKIMENRAKAQKALHEDASDVLYLFPFPYPELYSNGPNFCGEFDFDDAEKGSSQNFQIVHFGNLFEILSHLLPSNDLSNRYWQKIKETADKPNIQ
jgi:transcriptional regulator with XRE-family HTH domain